MKNKCKKLSFLLVLLLLAGSLLPFAAAGKSTYVYPPVTGLTSDDTLGNEHAPITQDLISMVNHNAQLKALLTESIARAAQINPDRKTNPAQTLAEYYDFIDWASKAMPWNILDLSDCRLYEKIDQSLDYFYFLNDQPLEALAGKGYYNNSIQYVEPYRSWMINYTTQWGQYLNTTASWNEEAYQLALADERFGLNTGIYEDPSNWTTFNQFFARHLKSPDMRPIDALVDDSVVVSPADSKPQGVWQIDENSLIISDGGVDIKSNYFASVEVLLGESVYKSAFAGGTLTHTFLDVNDYHRYHFPVSGIIKEVFVIPADDAAGGITIWDAEKGKYMLQAQQFGWQNIETRGCVIIETLDYGLVAVLPIGMSQVSSVNFEDTVQVGTQVKKGDMLGCFLFGGSDIVMLFQKGADFKLTAPQLEDGSYDHINMGNAYGVLNSTLTK